VKPAKNCIYFLKNHFMVKLRKNG